jgi:phosphate transport system substrate-binding protein
MRPFRQYWIGLLCWVALVFACSKPPSTERIVVTGASTLAPLASDIAARFEKEHPGVIIDVQTGGSARGAADARNGTAHIGMVSRELKETERDLHGFPVARDGVGLIVHRDNPLIALTRAQVIAIYTGALRDWQALTPGRPSEIAVVHKAAGRSTNEIFLEHFGLQDSKVRPSVVIGDNEQGIKTVAGNPNAIGYVSIGAAIYSMKHEVPIKLVPVDGLAPRLEAVQAGTYPIARPLQWVTKTTPSGTVREFIDYSRSKAVHDLISQHVFVPARS